MLIQGYYPHVGGAERQLASLAPCLMDQGLSVTVYTRRTGDLPEFELVSGVPVHRLPIPGSRATRSLSFTAHALNQLRQSRPDIIHAHDLFSPSTTALLAKRLFNIPVVAKVVRGGYLGDLQWLGRRAFGQSRVKTLCRNIDRFVTISKEIDDELRDLGVQEERRAFIPNGVDCSRFSPIGINERTLLRKSLNLPDAPTVIFTGRLAIEKRVEDLVTIWPSVREKIPDATLLIVGSGDQEVALKAASGPGIIFTGAVDDTAPFLKAADIFVLPSEAEGLSNALLEAMASGLACIVSDVGGARDLITTEKSGILIPPASPALLYENIITLSERPQVITSMGKLAREHVAGNYSLDYVAKSLNSLYHEVVKSNE